MKLFYSDTYVAASDDFDTTRKARWIVQSLRADPVAGVDLVEPAPLRRQQVTEVHDAAYVEAVETGEPAYLASSSGLAWDPEVWPMVMASNGGAVAAAEAALRDGVAGSLSSGMHHASRTRGGGFCTFNGLVIAARAALAAGAESVLILDLDAHCGGGTASLIGGSRRLTQVDVSVSAVDSYTSTEQSCLTMVRRAPEYLPAIEQELGRLVGEGARFDLCVYNAGMDPHEDCLLGGLPGIDADILAQREQLVFEWCREHEIPVAFVLAGGYIGGALDRERLVRLHRLTIEHA